MKTPEELSLKLARQWGNAQLREARLLDDADAWPISLAIGSPTSKAIASDLDRVKQHLARWRQVGIGSVVWQSNSFRATSEAVEVPVRWELHQPAQWVDACKDRTIRSEFDALTIFIERTDPVFHSLLIRRRSLWRQRSTQEVVHACLLALELEPGCADGKPLRAVSILGPVCQPESIHRLCEIT